MAVPTTREEFKQYCLRKLGSPVIEINVSDDQIDDRIDQALSYYGDYHFDATEKLYYKYLVTQTDANNGYITLPENVIGAVRIFSTADLSVSSAGEYMFDPRYQIAINDLYTINTESLVPYYMNIQYLSVLTEILVGEIPIRYTRHTNRLKLDTRWSKLVGRYIIVEAYEVIDPNTYADVWKDRWLQNYATALIKQNWGANLTKFTNMVLPGGIQFNGERILSDANDEIAKLEEQMSMSYSLPAMDFYG